MGLDISVINSNDELVEFKQLEMEDDDDDGPVVEEIDVKSKEPSLDDLDDDVEDDYGEDSDADLDDENIDDDIDFDIEDFSDEAEDDMGGEF